MLVSSYLILKKYLAIYHFIFKRVFPLSLFLIFDFEIQNIKNTVVFPRFITNRSSHWRCAVRKGVFRNFAKFIGKHLCKILFFNSLREKCLYSELFWSAFSRIRTEYLIESECGKMLTRITPNKDTFHAVYDFDKCF